MLYFKNLCNFTQYYEKFTLISESHHATGIKTTSGEIGDIGFHAVCDPCIQIWENSTKATQKYENLNENAVCFMNRPMKFEEEVHLYGTPHYTPDKSFKEIPVHLKLGLTNINPVEIREAKYLKEFLQVHSEINCFLDVDSFGFDCTHLCISLNIDDDGTCTLFTRVNKNRNYSYKYLNILPDSPIWLVIEPFKINTIRISSN